MSLINNPLELYKLLKKTNCRQCLLPSCMAFAVAVIQGERRLEECPYLDRETLPSQEGVVTRSGRGDEQQKILSRLKAEIGGIDFAEAAGRLDAQWRDGRLAVNCLGKDFAVDAAGAISGECHQNLWVQVPLLHYIIHAKGKPVAGEWVAFGDLPGAAEWSNFFSHRCEQAIWQLADAHGELLFEILDLFGATPVSGVTNADRSLMIRPLPRVPLLINYWEAEEQFSSKLNLLCDRTAADNLGVEAIYLLGRGMVEMFRALIARHSRDGKLFP